MNAKVSYVCLALFCFVDRIACLFRDKDVMLCVRCMISVWVCGCVCVYVCVCVCVCVCEFRIQVFK